MKLHAAIPVVFFKTEQGKELVRRWLKELAHEDRKRVGEDIKVVQYGWPLGFPLVRKLEAWRYYEGRKYESSISWQ